MRLSLRVKFSLLVLGLILVIMLANWRLSLDQQSRMEKAIAEHQRSTMRGELAKRAGNIFSFLAANGEALAIGDYLTVDAFVRDITAGSSDIRSIQIVRAGRVVVPISAAPQDFRPPAWLKPAGDAEQFEPIETPEGERLLVASGPVIDRSINRRVADAYVVISRKPIQDAIAAAQNEIKAFGRQARNNLTLASALFAVLGVIGAILLVTYVVRPINTLARGAKIIGDGNLDHEVDIRTNDEVGDLARMFNVMTKNLKEDQVQLIEKEKLEQELNIAMQIQRTLLPKSLPKVAGFDFGAVYTAAREVGGDYYDFMNIRGNGHQKTAVVVADVSGKGIPGAFVMALTRSILRASALTSRSPSEVLKSTNTALLADIKKGMFVSMFYGLLDGPAAKLEFGSAGHNPTLVYRAATGDVESIRCHGLALGIGKAPVFERTIETKEIVLHPGDICFQYTDGIQHAMNGRQERFGMDRLTACLREFSAVPAQKLVAEILSRVEAFCGGQPQFDDITMVAVKREHSAKGA